MVVWHHQLNGHELEKTLGDGEDWHAAVHGIFQARVLEWGAIAFSDYLASFSLM